jgi:hypothetical protein
MLGWSAAKQTFLLSPQSSALSTYLPWHLTPIIKEHAMDKTILLIATHDTKEDEARFLKSCIQANGFKVLVMDTGRYPPE